MTVKSGPGFVVNRILLPMINEAFFVLAEGDASATEIDQAMKLGCNHPIGPLALADMIGLDVLLSVMQTIHDEFADSKYQPCPLLKEMVAAGYLGRKTRRGVYRYKPVCNDRSHHNSPVLTPPHSTIAQSSAI